VPMDWTAISTRRALVRSACGTSFSTDREGSAAGAGSPSAGGAPGVGRTPVPTTVHAPRSIGIELSRRVRRIGRREKIILTPWRAGVGEVNEFAPSINQSSWPLPGIPRALGVVKTPGSTTSEREAHLLWHQISARPQRLGPARRLEARRHIEVLGRRVATGGVE
jgi:hypothetical protein